MAITHFQCENAFLCFGYALRAGMLQNSKTSLLTALPIPSQLFAYALRPILDGRNSPRRIRGARHYNRLVKQSSWHLRHHVKVNRRAASTFTEYRFKTWEQRQNMINSNAENDGADCRRVCNTYLCYLDRRQNLHNSLSPISRPNIDLWVQRCRVLSIRDRASIESLRKTEITI